MVSTRSENTTASSNPNPEPKDSNPNSKGKRKAPPSPKQSHPSKKTTTTTTDQDSPKATSTSDSSPKNLSLTLNRGDIFAAPQNTVLIHACNTQGSWGAGIAAAFKAQYPEAYKIYHAHCTETYNPKSKPVPTGSCLLIPPCENDAEGKKHWIACLFTSAKYGRGKDAPSTILANTGPAMRDLLGQVKQLRGEGREVSGLRMCKINSARFGVPWERTVRVLEGIEVEEGWDADVEVWTIDKD